MSAICGYHGAGDDAALRAMLGAVRHRGDTDEVWVGEGVGLGYRHWKGRPGKSPGIHAAPDGRRVACAGTFAPALPDPSAALGPLLDAGDLSTLDGAFGAALWDPARRTLSLVRDPFGVRSLYWVEHRGVFWFASELKQLLALPGLPVELDASAIHRYLTFSFVPGDTLPIRGVHRVPTGSLYTRGPEGARTSTWFSLRDTLPEDPPPDQATAVRRTWRLGRKAVAARLNGEPTVGLYLSGGIDSAAVAVWLRDLGADVRSFHLDFGEAGVDRESAEEVISHLQLPVTRVPVTAAAIAARVESLAWALDLPFGDAVTGPHLLLAEAARAEGLTAVFNGEGGDQLFGGWTSKPMVAAALFGGLVDERSPEEEYLSSYHRFYGLEASLYTPAFAAAVGPPGQRRALLSPWLGAEGPFLHRVRFADIALKGSHNILPRAERVGNSVGLDVRVPLFDRRLARHAFRLPPDLKLRGACEKYVLKLAMQGRLPDAVVWRRKFGMSVPVTDWLLGPRGSTAPTPFTPLLDELLGPEAVRRRGLFRAEYVEELRAGRDEPTVTRRRRVGEKLWALLMLELWLRRFVDRRGQP